MQQKTLIALALLAIIVGVRLWIGSAPSENDSLQPNTRFLQFTPLTPLTEKSPLAELQNAVDHLCEMVLKDRWSAASQEAQQLEQTWQNFQKQKDRELETEREISHSIQTLHSRIWAKDKEGVLLNARKLTELISRLSI